MSSRKESDAGPKKCVASAAAGHALGRVFAPARICDSESAADSVDGDAGSCAAVGIEVVGRVDYSTRFVPRLAASAPGAASAGYGAPRTTECAAGRRVKNSFAMRASTAGSGRPAGSACRLPAKSGPSPSFTKRRALFSFSLVLMVVSDFDIFERRNGVVHQHGRRAVQRNQVRSESFAADPHEAYGETRSLFTGQSGLEQTNHTLFLLTYAQQQDVGFSACVLRLGAAVNLQLVRRDQGNSAPGNERSPEQRDRGRRDAAARALAAERSNRARMGEKERRLFPNFSQKFIEIIGSRSALTCLNSLTCRNIFQQAVVAVIDQFAFLAFLHVFNHQAQLFANLVIWIAVKIGDARLHIEHGGNGAQGVLARFFFVLYVRLGQSLLVLLPADDFHRLAIHYAIDAQASGLQRLPVQQADQPSWSDRSILRRSFGYIGKLKCCAIAQRVMGHIFGHEWFSFAVSILVMIKERQ